MSLILKKASDQQGRRYVALGNHEEYHFLRYRRETLNYWAQDQ